MGQQKITSVGRRDFLKTIGATAVVGTTVVGSSVIAADTSTDSKRITQRKLGKFGPVLPILAYGGAGLPKAWGNTLSIEDRVRLVRYAYDRGIRMFDTAGNYMESAPIIGEALKSVRDGAFLVSKVETTDPAWVRARVEHSLKQLRTDYLDACLIHGTPGLEQMTIPQAMKIHAELVKLRDEKIIRSIGFSAHSYFDKARALIDTDGFELCMLAYGYIPRGHNQIFSPRMIELRETCIARAHERGMGIIAMKVIGAGVLGAWSGYIVPSFDKRRLGQLPRAAIRHVLNDERVDLLVIGMRRKIDIDGNIKTLTGDTTYTAEDKALLAEFTAKALESEKLRSMKVE